MPNRERHRGLLTLRSLLSALSLGSWGALVSCAPPPPSSGGRAPSPAVARADSAAQAAIANERGINPSAFPPRSVGVAPLAVFGSDTSLASLGWGLADLLTTDLAMSRSLTVVERVHVNALLRELRLAASGRVDSTSAPRFGRLLGARQVVTGSVVVLPDMRLQLSTRLADVLSGTARAGEASTIQLDRILDAEKTLAFSLFTRLGVNLSPAERAAVEQRPTANILAFLAFSRGVREEALGNYAAAARAYQDAVRIDPGFTRARARLQSLDAAVAVSNPRDVRAENEGVRRAASLAVNGINRSVIPPRSDVSDASFRNNFQQLVILIIRVSVP